MKKDNINNGFDRPKNLKEQDRLNRWNFAEEIYAIVRNTPKEWSVRIGIYGGWGEGKTTILEFLNTIASKNNITVWLNTWQFQNSEQLWEEFVLSIYRELKKSKVPLRAYKKLWLSIIIFWKRFLRKIILPLQPLTKLHQYSEVGMGILNSFLKFNKKIMYDLPNYIQDKKVIVLIDDLDRANPLIIPQILFGIKEILDIKGMVFVVAIDPDVINETLNMNNIIIGKEKNYLDKIIDFPKWLPEPDESNYKRYLQKEFEDSINFIEYDPLLQVFRYLKKNPRKLKLFVRSLIVFKEEITRYTKDEINFTLLLLIVILKTNYPKYYNHIITHNELWSDLETDNWFGSSLEKSHQKSEETIKSLLSSFNISDEDKNNIGEIIKHVASITKYNISLTLKSHANFTQAKSLLTWKEYNVLLNEFEKNSSKLIIEEKIKEIEVNKEDFLKELFNKSIRYREWSLNQASDSNLETELNSHVKDANLALKLIKIICFEFEGFIGNNPFLGIEEFSELYKMISRWLHFTMPDIYKSTRTEEKNFLTILCQQMTIELKPAMNFLKPWFPYRTGAYDSPAEKILSEELGKIIEERIANTLIDKFMAQGWVYSIFNPEEYFVEQYILLRKDSYFWTGELKHRFFQFSSLEDKKEIVALNAIHFISLIDYTFFDPHGYRSVFNENNAIIYDRDIMIKIWELATKQVINPRMFKSLENFLERINYKTKIELLKPKWWEEIKKMVADRSREE